MNEPRTTAIAISNEPVRAWTTVWVQGSINGSSRVFAWARETAQHFSVLLSTLMGPATVSTYALAAWSLAQNLGWTDTFVFSKGPLSNWLVWLLIAGCVTAAAEVLKRHAQPED